MKSTKLTLVFAAAMLLAISAIQRTSASANADGPMPYPHVATAADGPMPYPHVATAADGPMPYPHVAAVADGPMPYPHVTLS
jgi:hypothetical protein